MKLQVLSNLNYPVGNIINQELTNAVESKIAVAFVKYTGLKVIQDSLINTLEKNGKVEIIAGLDLRQLTLKQLNILLI